MPKGRFRQTQCQDLLEPKWLIRGSQGDRGVAARQEEARCLGLFSRGPAAKHQIGTASVTAPPLPQATRAAALSCAYWERAETHTPIPQRAPHKAHVVTKKSGPTKKTQRPCPSPSLCLGLRFALFKAGSLQREGRQVHIAKKQLGVWCRCRQKKRR